MEEKPLMLEGFREDCPRCGAKTTPHEASATQLLDVVLMYQCALCNQKWGSFKDKTPKVQHIGEFSQRRDNKQ